MMEDKGRQAGTEGERRTNTGTAGAWRGSGAGARRGWALRQRVGSSWNVMDVVRGPGDMTGDGRSDLLARESATGVLWLYPGNGAGSLGTRVSLGKGWNVMTGLVAAGDMDGDRMPDLLARDGAGSLWLCSGPGIGAFQARVRV